MTCSSGHKIATENGYCPQCAICVICSKPLNAQQYKWAQEQPRIAHPVCLASELPRDTASLTIDQSTFNILNACRLMLEPRRACSESTNVYDAECQLNSSHWVHEMSLEEKFLFLSRLESLAASMSYILSKDRERIKIELNKREKEHFAQAAKQARDTNRPKAERHVLTLREKAIKALMAIPGMTEENAIASVDERLRAQGKVIQ